MCCNITIRLKQTFYSSSTHALRNRIRTPYYAPVVVPAKACRHSLVSSSGIATSNPVLLVWRSCPEISQSEDSSDSYTLDIQVSRYQVTHIDGTYATECK